VSVSIGIVRKNTNYFIEFLAEEERRELNHVEGLIAKMMQGRQRDGAVWDTAAESNRYRQDLSLDPYRGKIWRKYSAGDSVNVKRIKR
jgi:hypothetical protein